MNKLDPLSLFHWGVRVLNRKMDFINPPRCSLRFTSLALKSKCVLKHIQRDPPFTLPVPLSFLSRGGWWVRMTKKERLIIMIIIITGLVEHLAVKQSKTIFSSPCQRSFRSRLNQNHVHTIVWSILLPSIRQVQKMGGVGRGGARRLCYQQSSKSNQGIGGDFRRIGTELICPV